jgi:serralysin
MRKLLLPICVSIVALVALAPSSAEAKFDRSYGEGAVVRVDPARPPGTFISQLAGARSGDAFALYEGCDARSCDLLLFRYGSDGSLDGSFPAEGFNQPPRPEDSPFPALAVDSRGRPVLVEGTADRLEVRRLTSAGTVDPTFGDGGAAGIACDCAHSARPHVVPGSNGALTVVVPVYGDQEGISPSAGASFVLVRLRSDGSLDRSFGRGGKVRITVPDADILSSEYAQSATFAAALSPGGGVYLAGTTCCAKPTLGYLVRVSARGRLDSHFAAATRRTLAGLGSRRVLGGKVSAIVVRPRGKVDLLGAAGSSSGFELRLTPDGRPFVKFARRGLRELPMAVEVAALGSEGATLTLGQAGRETLPIVSRILPGGRLDPAFGRRPGETAALTSPPSLALVPQDGHKALILDLGYIECRYGCSAVPKLIRVLEGPFGR